MGIKEFLAGIKKIYNGMPPILTPQRFDSERFSENLSKGQVKISFALQVNRKYLKRKIDWLKKSELLYYDLVGKYNFSFPAVAQDIAIHKGQFAKQFKWGEGEENDDD